MILKLKFVVDTEMDKDEIEEKFRSILRNTADYQHSDISVLALGAIGSEVDDSVEVFADISRCRDNGHTRHCMKELFEYIYDEFI